MTRGTPGWLLTFAATAAATWLLLVREDEEAAPATTSIEDADLGYYLIDARLVGLDADGREFYTLGAARIEQLPGDGGVTMQVVSIDYASRSETPWHVDALSGRIPASGELIELAGDVRLTRAGATARDALTIATPTLELAIHERVARTLAPVELKQGADTLSATGLEADLQNERLSLRSLVRAHFQAGAS